VSEAAGFGLAGFAATDNVELVPGWQRPLELHDSVLIGMIARGDGGSVWIVGRQADLPWTTADPFADQIEEPAALDPKVNPAAACVGSPFATSTPTPVV
jgi:hypothetical protein